MAEDPAGMRPFQNAIQAFDQFVTRTNVAADVIDAFISNLEQTQRGQAQRIDLSEQSRLIHNGIVAYDRLCRASQILCQELTQEKESIISQQAQEIEDLKKQLSELQAQSGPQTQSAAQPDAPANVPTGEGMPQTREELKLLFQNMLNQTPHQPIPSPFVPLESAINVPDARRSKSPMMSLGTGGRISAMTDAPSLPGLSETLPDWRNPQMSVANGGNQEALRELSRFMEQWGPITYKRTAETVESGYYALSFALNVRFPQELVTANELFEIHRDQYWDALAAQYADGDERKLDSLLLKGRGVTDDDLKLLLYRIGQRVSQPLQLGIIYMQNSEFVVTLFDPIFDQQNSDKIPIAIFLVEANDHAMATDINGNPALQYQHWYGLGSIKRSVTVANMSSPVDQPMTVRHKASALSVPSLAPRAPSASTVAPTIMDPIDIEAPITFKDPSTLAKIGRSTKRNVTQAISTFTRGSATVGQLRDFTSLMKVQHIDYGWGYEVDIGIAGNEKNMDYFPAKLASHLKSTARESARKANERGPSQCLWIHKAKAGNGLRDTPNLHDHDGACDGCFKNTKIPERMLCVIPLDNTRVLIKGWGSTAQEGKQLKQAEHRGNDSPELNHPSDLTVRKSVRKPTALQGGMMPQDPADAVEGSAGLLQTPGQSLALARRQPTDMTILRGSYESGA